MRGKCCCPEKNSLFLNLPHCSITMIIRIFFSDTGWMVLISITSHQLSYFQRVRRQCCLVQGGEVDAVYAVGVNQVDDAASFLIKNFHSRSEYLQCDSRKTEFPHHYLVFPPPFPSPASLYASRHLSVETPKTLCCPKFCPKLSPAHFSASVQSRI